MMAAWCSPRKGQTRSTNDCADRLEGLRASAQAARRALEAIEALGVPGCPGPALLARQALAAMNRLEER